MSSFGGERRAILQQVACEQCGQLVCEPETCPLELLNQLKALVAALNEERMAIPMRQVAQWRRLSAILEEW